jgi:hypothetical protein
MHKLFLKMSENLSMRRFCEKLRKFFNIKNIKKKKKMFDNSSMIGQRRTGSIFCVWKGSR